MTVAAIEEALRAAESALVSVDSGAIEGCEPALAALLQGDPASLAAASEHLQRTHTLARSAASRLEDLITLFAVDTAGYAPSGAPASIGSWVSSQGGSCG